MDEQAYFEGEASVTISLEHAVTQSRSHRLGFMSNATNPSSLRLDHIQHIGRVTSGLSQSKHYHCS
jgi:hypothetical protein